jgi:hypothetical protein
VREAANHHRISRQHHLLRETPGSWHVKPTPRDHPKATSHLTPSHLVHSDADLTYYPRLTHVGTCAEKLQCNRLAVMATVTEALKEKVLGTELEPQLSAQTRNNFLQYAKKDEASDEYYMTETEFVDAIAPEGEDYVSTCWHTSS